jgi:hypothetical protein
VPDYHVDENRRHALTRQAPAKGFECNGDMDEAAGAADAIACSGGGSFVRDECSDRVRR